MKQKVFTNVAPQCLTIEDLIGVDTVIPSMSQILHCQLFKTHQPTVFESRFLEKISHQITDVTSSTIHQVKQWWITST